MSKHNIEIAITMMGMLGGILTSLGTITPKAVKKLGGILTDHLANHPSNILLRQAYNHAGISPLKSPTSSIGGCLIEFGAMLITLFLSALLVIVVLIGFWAYALSQSTTSHYRIVWLISGQISFILGLSGIVDLTDARKDEGIPPWGSRFLKVFARVSDPVGLLVYCGVYPIMRIFTMVLPRLWYRGLKAVHARGWEWLFAWIGLGLLLISGFLQMYVTE